MATGIEDLKDLRGVENPNGSEAFGPEPDGPYAEYRARADARIQRSDSGRWLSTHLLTICAVAGALPAMRAPIGWLAVCSVGAIVMLGFDAASRQREEQHKAGSADVVVVPARVVGKVALNLINPVTWLTVLLGAVVALVVGSVAAALVAGARWLAIEGPTGIPAALRAGAWAHGLTYSAVVACFLLLRAGGDTAARRQKVLRRVTRTMPEITLTLCVVVLVGAGAALAVAGPTLDVGFVRNADGLGWLPPGLRATVDEARDDLVTQELDAVTACISDAQPDLWTSRYTKKNVLTDADVATLVADPATAPDPVALATAALVADNHLAPWVETIDVLVGDQPVLTIARAGHAHDQPVTDAAALRDRAVGAPEWLTTVAPDVDSARVLTCSARTPL